MIASWFRRAAMALACVGGAALLAACGSGSVVSDLTPKRFISVGDGFADVGQNGHRYTVNDGTPNWLQKLAAEYSLTLTAATAGGFGYAQGHARVDSADTSSGTNAPSVKQQVDAVLARTALIDGDVVFLGGGISDIVAAVGASGISDATTQTVRAAGKALAAQVRRVVQAGGTHVVITGVPNLGSTPWARGRGQGDAIESLSNAFNDALKVDIADLGQNVLYFDAALFFNLIYNKPDAYPIDNITNPVCTTPDASTCTTSTLLPGADYNRYLFADSLYFTPAAQRLFVNGDQAENVLDRFKDRW